jgi:hypothetical protein
MRLYKCVCSIVLVAMLLPICEAPVSANPSNDVIPAENKYALLCASTTFLYLLNYPEPARDAPIENYGAVPWVDELLYDVRDVLVEDYDWLPSHITILLNEKDTKANVLQGITDLKQYDDHGPNSLFLVISCGHGWVIKDTDGDESAYPPVPGTTRNGVDVWDECQQHYDGIPGGAGKATNMVNFIIDDEFKALFNELDFQGRLVVQFMGCLGSGLIEDIAGPNRLAIGVGNADRLEEHWGYFLDGYFYGLDFYPWYALSRCTEIPYVDLHVNPDSNGDGKVSMEEAWFWADQAFAATRPNIINYGGPCHIYMVDGIEGETFL